MSDGLRLCGYKAFSYFTTEWTSTKRKANQCLCVWVDPYASALPNINSCVGKEDKMNRPHYTVYKGSSIIPSYQILRYIQNYDVSLAYYLLDYV